MLKTISRLFWPKELTSILDTLESGGTVEEINLLNIKIGEDGAKALIKALEENSNTKLKKISIAWEHIGRDAGILLAKVLVKITSIREAYYSSAYSYQGYRAEYADSNELFSIGEIFWPIKLRNIIDTLKQNAVVEEINLENTDIYDVGAKALAQALEKNTMKVLRKINVKNCKISEGGMAAITTQIKKINTVVEINLQENHIDNKRLHAMIDMYSLICENKDYAAFRNHIITLTNSDVTELKLSTKLSANTEIRNEQLNDLSKSWINNKFITKVHIDHNSLMLIKNHDLYLENIIEKNKNIVEVELRYYNDLTSIEHKRINRIIRRNRGPNDLKKLVQILNEGNETIIHFWPKLSEDKNIYKTQFEQLLKAFANNTAVDKLDIRNIESDEINNIKLLLDVQFSILHLWYNDDDIQDKDKIIIDGYLQRNLNHFHFNNYINNLLSKKYTTIPSLPSLSKDAKIRGNQLSRLSETFKLCTAEKTLRLARLNEAYYEIIVYLIAKNTNITELDLSGHDLRASDIEIIAKIVTNNIGIQKLNLYSCKLGDNGVTLLAKVLENNNTIIELNLGHNSIKAEGVKAISSMLSKNATLRKLNLKKNNIDDAGAEIIVLGLEKNTTLLELGLDFVSTGWETFKTIINEENENSINLCLTRNKELLEFKGLIDDLEDGKTTICDYKSPSVLNNIILENQLKVLVQLLKSNNTVILVKLHFKKINDDGILILIKTLTKINIPCEIKVNNKISAEGIKALIIALEKNTIIQKLDVSMAQEQDDNEDTGTKKYRNNRQKNATSQKVNDEKEYRLQIEVLLSRNRQYLEVQNATHGLKNQSITHFKHRLTFSEAASVKNDQLHDYNNAWRSNTSVHEINLEIEIDDHKSLKISADDAKILAQALIKNTSVTTLNLNYNDIGDAGAIAFAHMLEIKDTACNLHIAGNNITDEGAKAFASIIEKNSNLQVIDLGRNNITDKGLKAIALALQYNSHLRIIYLNHNQITNKGANFLIQALEINTTIQNIFLEGNNITKSTLSSINDKLSLNRSRPPAIHNNSTPNNKSTTNTVQTSATTSPKLFSAYLQSQSTLIIPPTSLQKKECIGIGSYGKVFHGVFNGKPVAIKELFDQTENEKSKIIFQHEVNLLSTLNHNNIISFYGIVLENPRAIVMEYAAGGTLYMLLHNDKIELPWKERIRLAHDIAKGIAYLHQCNPPVLHCDLKSENVLLSENRQIKLTDFGLAKTKINSSGQSSVRGTPSHMAPEIIELDEDLLESKYTTKVDIYSFAIIMWEIATRERPFSGVKSAFQVMNMIKEGKRPRALTIESDNYKQLVVTCWSQKPCDRPDAQVVVKNLEVQHQASLVALPSVTLSDEGFLSIGNSWTMK